jgi:hypothetical protein
VTRRRPWVLAALASVLALGLAINMTRPHYGEALGYTRCPFFGDARVTLMAGIVPEDTLPVREHEEIHAGQCRERGPFGYRFTNLTPQGKLGFEAPAYCAGARARLSQGGDSVIVRERLIDDVTAAFRGAAKPAAVLAALRSACPEIVR